MITYFRAYDPIRIISIILLLLAIRLPFILFGDEVPNLQIDLMNVGQRLASGNTMYLEVWDTLEPLSAGFYWIVNLLFGKSFLALKLIGFALICFQAIYFAIVINIHNLYRERSFVPALLYIFIASCFADMFYVTPLLMGITFLLPVFHWMFVNLKINAKEEYFYFSAIFISIASLFQFYLCVFFLWQLLYLVLFIKPSIRVYFISVIGFLFPIISVILYYYLSSVSNPIGLYLKIFAMGTVSEQVITLRSLFVCWIPAIATLLIGIIYTIRITKYINFQFSVIKIMLLYTFLAIVCVLFAPIFQPSLLLLFLPSIVFLGGNYFHHYKSFWFTEVPFLLLAAFCMLLTYGSINPRVNQYLRIVTDKIFVDKVEKYQQFANKKLLVLGSNRSAYLYGKATTPFINWKFSKGMFLKDKNYEKLTLLYYWLSLERPQFILDEEGLLPELLHHIPEMENQYRKQAESNVYELKM